MLFKIFNIIFDYSYVKQLTKFFLELSRIRMDKPDLRSRCNAGLVCTEASKPELSS